MWIVGLKREGAELMRCVWMGWQVKGKVANTGIDWAKSDKKKKKSLTKVVLFEHSFSFFF